jgi:hypothetical protein
MTLKEQIVKTFLNGKTPLYIIQEGEQQLIDIMEDVINGLLEEKKYLNDNYNRILDTKLNQDEIISEQKDLIKQLKKEIEKLNR